MLQNFLPLGNFYMLLSLVHCAIALLSSALQSQQQHALGEGGFSKGGLSAEKPKLILG